MCGRPTEPGPAFARTASTVIGIAVLVQRFHDLNVALVAGRLELGQPVAQLAGRVVDEEHEQVHRPGGSTGELTGDLAARDQPQRVRAGGGAGLRHVVEGVVVGERQRRQPCFTRQLDDPCRRVGSVRHRRVAVQVDHERASAASARGAGPVNPTPSRYSITWRGRRRYVAIVRDDPHLGRRRRFVRIRYAGELGDLTRARPLVQTLHVALLADLDRRVDVDLDEPVDGRPDLVAHRAVRRDRRRHRHDPVAGQQRRDPPDAADVRVPIGLREPESRRQVLAHLVAVEQLDAMPTPAQLVRRRRRRSCSSPTPTGP